MYVTRIKVANIRAIKELELPLGKSSLPLQSVFIGKNSTCKTSLLRCLALGLCDQSQATALLSELPGSLVGDWGDTATIEITLSSSRKKGREFVSITKIKRQDLTQKKRREASLYEDKIVKHEFQPSRATLPPLFVCAYGAGRGLDGADSWDRYQPVDAVYSLFNNVAELLNPELILHRAKDYYKGKWGRLTDALRKVLGLSKRHRFSLTYTGVRVSGPDIGNRVPLAALADGYKGTFLWLCDFIGWAMLAGELGRTIDSIEGILIIDEIEQHLHPSLQIDLLPRLRRCFPRLQVICSTHSPFIPLSISSKGLFSLKRDRGRVRLMAQVEGLSHYAVQDVSEDARLFNVRSAESKTLTRDVSEYQKLSHLPPSRRTRKTGVRLKALARRLADSGIPLKEELKLFKTFEQLNRSADA
jgi:hypothetical protein